MGTAERRSELLKCLCRRRHDTISNLANEFNVSERTIRRDIEILSLTEPIYTQSGRYGGGVYVMDDYDCCKLYHSDDETSLLQKLYRFAQMQERCVLSEDELKMLSHIKSYFEKPKRKETNDEK